MPYVSQRWLGDTSGKSFGLDSGFSDEKHAARIAMKAIFDDRNVDIDRIACLERLVPRDSVTDHVIDRRTDRFRETAVVQWGRNRLLNARDVVMADSIQLAGCHSGFDIIPNHIQYVGGEPASDPHFVLLIGRLYRYRHRNFAVVTDSPSDLILSEAETIQLTILLDSDVLENPRCWSRPAMV